MLTIISIIFLISFGKELTITVTFTSVFLKNMIEAPKSTIQIPKNSDNSNTHKNELSKNPRITICTEFIPTSAKPNTIIKEVRIFSQ